MRGISTIGAKALMLAVSLFSLQAFGHTIEGGDASFVEAIDGPAIGPFIYLGAKHMVTGYDHLLFLLGVIFFLYRPKHVVQYVTLFAIGHSITLLLGVLANLQVNAYFIDAIIGLSVVYKAFENIDGFKRVFGFQPNTKVAVFVMVDDKLADSSFLRHGVICCLHAMPSRCTAPTSLTVIYGSLTHSSHRKDKQVTVTH